MSGAFFCLSVEREKCAGFQEVIASRLSSYRIRIRIRIKRSHLRQLLHDIRAVLLTTLFGCSS
ncbi:hypothetical protein AK821_22095 [Pseudomonas sp. RIT-PI-r]|nr:hypothetical protein AK821_22095 [Pseudomonas sp. RIT-PI-r]